MWCVAGVSILMHLQFKIEDISVNHKFGRKWHIYNDSVLVLMTHCRDWVHEGSIIREWKHRPFCTRTPWCLHRLVSNTKYTLLPPLYSKTPRHAPRAKRFVIMMIEDDRNNNYFSTFYYSVEHSKSVFFVIFFYNHLWTMKLELGISLSADKVRIKFTQTFKQFFYQFYQFINSFRIFDKVCIYFADRNIYLKRDSTVPKINSGKNAFFSTESHLERWIDG